MWVEKTKDGKYKFREQYKNPLTGRYNKVSLTMDKNTNTTRRRAQIRLEKKIQDKLIHIQDGKIKKGVTLGQVITEWEPVYKKQVLSGTYYSWKTYKKQILARIGKDTLVSKITPKYLINTYEDMLYKESYDKSFVIQLKAKMNHIMKYAYHHDYISSLPTANLQINWPKNRHAPTTEEKFLEDDELEAVLNFIEEKTNSPYAHVYRSIFEWQALTGMRIGEAATLYVHNIYKKGEDYYADVHGTLVYHGLKLSEQYKSPITKTNTSYRTVLLPDRAVEIYKELSAGKKQNDLLFSIKGHFVLIDSLNQVLRICKKNLGINKPLSTHIFRHTHVSKLAEMGVPLYIIQNRLGHSDSEITSRVYLHVTKKAKEKYDGIIKSM